MPAKKLNFYSLVLGLTEARSNNVLVGLDYTELSSLEIMKSNSIH